MLKHTLSVLFLAFLAHLSANAQPVNNLVKDIVMPAPNAGSLGKYGDIPVSYFTGVPNISVPIHTVQEGPLSLPVSLSYHASGIKVAETASWVGLGWSLNAGGMITRMVQGIPDDHLYGYYNSVVPNINTLTPLQRLEFLQKTSTGIIDSEPDIFTFNFAGYSGKFYFDNNHIPQLIPRQDIKIQVSGSNPFQSFTLLTPDGTRYVFGQTTNPVRTAQEFSRSASEPQGQPSSWYLLRIESYDANHAIDLYYDADEYYSYQNLASCKYYYRLNNDPACSATQVPGPVGDVCTSSTGEDAEHPTIRTNIQGKRLTKITCSTSTVEFIANEDRLDLDANIALGIGSKKALNEIKIYNAGTLNNEFCHKYTFSYGYYQDPNKTITESKRLKLTQLQHIACNDAALNEPPYVFTYDESGNLPYRLSKQTDHWGFFNGQSGNETKTVNVPSTTIYSSTSATYTYGSSNRESVETHLKKGVLKEIKYPTGGKTTFTYEANKLKVAEESSPQYIPTNSQYWLKSCNDPYTDNVCCGSQKKKSLTHTFTTETLSSIKYNLYLRRLGNPGPICGYTPTYVAVTLTVYNLSDPMAPSVGSFGINLATNETDYLKTGFLGTLVPSLQANANYKFELTTTDGYAYFHMFTTPTTESDKIVGGLRIKEIRNHDGIDAANDVIRTYDYSAENSAFSSGKLMYSVRYAYQSPSIGFVWADNNVLPMGGFGNGYHVGYERVKETLAGNANNGVGSGYTVYTFHALPAPAPSLQFPYAPAMPIYPQGEIKTVGKYKNDNSSVSMERRFERSESLSYSTGNIYKVSPGLNCFVAYPITNIYTERVYIDYVNYQIRHTPAFQLTSSEHTTDGVTTGVLYEYDGFYRHLAPTATYFYNSDGKVQRTENKYVFDLQNGDPVRQPLIDRNIIGAPLEVLNKVGPTYDNTTIVDGTKTEYSFFAKTTGAQTSSTANSEPRPWKFYKFDMTWDANGAYVYAPGNWVEQGRIVAYHGNGSTNGKGLPATFRPGNDAANWPSETYTWLNGLIKTRNYLNFAWAYDYYPGTRLVSKATNMDGQVKWYSYDKLMRLVKISARPNNVADELTANVKTIFSYAYQPITPTQRNSVKAQTTYTPVANSGLGTVEDFQYFDGLGRLVQTVGKQQSPALLDVVTNIQYDNQGREWKSYSPVQGIGNTGAFVATAPSGPHALTIYEPSPLSRPYSVTPPSWYPTTYAYGANAASEVKSDLAAGTWYAAGSLSKTTVTDPDNKTTITWKDKKGRALLTRKSNTANSTPADTYTLYDDQDRVNQVVPPADTVNGALCFKYLYDVSDNLISKTVPDGGTTNMVYNDRDLMVLSRDPNLLALNQWRATRYDDYGRVLRSGIYNSASAPAAPVSLTLEPSTVYLENIWDGTLPIEKGKIKTAKVRMFDDALTWLQTDYTYDAHGRVSQTNGNNHLNTALGSEVNGISLYDWADHVITESRAHKPTAAITRTLAQTHGYDHRGRLKSNTFSVDGAAAHTISELNYNWKDQLVEKNIGKAPGFANPLQSLDFAYNDQGWLTRVNQAALGGTSLAMASCPTAPALPNPGAASGTPDNNDLFYLELQYDQLYAGLTGTVQKNGNIAQAVWRVRGRERQSYSLGYDYLNRLTTSLYRNLNDAGTATNNANAYDENLAYDLRGNINTLTRRGKYKVTATSTCWTDGQIDNLAYTYTANTNRLQSIADSAPTGGAQNPQRNAGFNPGAGTGAYAYDANGNLATDPYKGMAVAYQSFLNLPKTFTFAGNKLISVLYDASGRKLRKTVTDNGALQYTQDYAGGIEYRSTPTKALALESFYHAEGRVFNTNVAAATTTEILRYEYALKDHLGNARLTFTDKNGNGLVDQTNLGSTNEIIQESHYYPFGLDLPGSWINDGGALDNQYKYNGKELNGDFGLGWMDYGARWYDGSVGRWWVVDDLGSHVNQMDKSPYAYAWNNPVILTDPDGNLPSNPQERNDCCNHLLGGLRAVGGLLQMAGGTALALAPEPTGLTKVGAGIAIGHGLDDFQAGIRQAFTGENTESLTFTTTKSAAQSLGANEDIAGKIATGTDIGLGFVGGGVFTKAATSRVATSEVVGQTVFHATSKEGAALNILNGINPKFFNPSSRFGRGFYVAKEQSTMLAELAHHGANPVNTISFSLSGGKFLNATSPLMDLGTKYIPLTLSGAARNMGYNGIIFNSLRNLNGTNAVIFNNFDLLKQGTIIK